MDPKMTLSGHAWPFWASTRSHVMEQCSCFGSRSQARMRI